MDRLLNAVFVDAGKFVEDGDIEICISDNSISTDSENTINRYAELLAAGFRRTRTGGGLSFGQNLHNVSQMATGDYIQFVGDDDIWNLGSCEILLHAIGDSDWQMIITASSRQAELRRELPSLRVEFSSLAELYERAGLFHASFFGNIAGRRDLVLKCLDQRAVLSAYAHSFIAPNHAEPARSLLLNVALCEVDDSDRTWKPLVWNYYAVDYARVQFELYCSRKIDRRSLTKARGRLIKSLPFALIASKIHADHGAQTAFGDTSIKNLLMIYGYGPFGLIVLFAKLFVAILPDSIGAFLLEKKNSVDLKRKM